jgi:hypothetical protein
MIYSQTEIEKAYKILQEVVKRENKLHLMDMTLNSCDVDTIEYEVLPLLESIIDYEPSDEEMSGEPPMSANEMHSAAWKQHQELHS